MECVNPIVMWAIENAPAANAQATISRASVAGQRHVCQGFLASITNGGSASADVGTLNLRDGATGAGAILWTMDFAIPGVSFSVMQIEITGLNIVGSVATAMTLEFAAASAVNVTQKVNLCGFDLV
jgi:hypothetical protein